MEGLVKPEIPRRSEMRSIAVLVAIAKIPKANCTDVVAVTGIPRRSVMEIIDRLRAVAARIERINSRKHGYYKLDATGPYALDKAEEVLVQQHPQVIQNIDIFKNLRGV